MTDIANNNDTKNEEVANEESYKEHNNNEKKALEDTLDKSQNDFEKQLSYISAGALGLTITFIEKIVPDSQNASNKWLIVTGWIFLAMTLLLNLVSHHLASIFTYNSLKELNEEVDNYTKRLLRDRIIHILNWITLVFIFLGIFCIVIFSSINI